MFDNRTASVIDLALQKHNTPVGPLFVAEYHVRMKKCFSRDTAIRYLAFFMTSHAFARSGFQQRHPDVKSVHPIHGEAWERGGVTREYHVAHQRCVRRLRRILARKREMQKWCEKYDAWVAQRDELMKLKPF
ncbi:hypothetical protein [Citrobacter portucalensis]|uniref:hypothetical protein n=1 Tax=Citrobacter portucalensis TaxID=1639133 RepID=UPI0023B1750B|nr:hypothetical protein [Citrobacter portucalensis]